MSECIISERCTDERGRPFITVGGKLWREHRYIASQIFKDFDNNNPDQIVMHICDNIKCINPEHLKLGTQADNMKDRDDKNRHGNSKKTHCIRGHELSGHNLVVTKKGTRNCRICKLASNRKNYSTEKRRKYYGKYPRW